MKNLVKAAIVSAVAFTATAGAAVADKLTVVNHSWTTISVNVDGYSAGGTKDDLLLGQSKEYGADTAVEIKGATFTYRGLVYGSAAHERKNGGIVLEVHGTAFNSWVEIKGVDGASGLDQFAGIRTDIFGTNGAQVNTFRAK